PGGATSRLGASALPISRNGSPLDMALSARIGGAREGGRKTQMPQQPAAFAARGRTAWFTPRRQGKKGRSGGGTGTPRGTAAAHSPQKKTSRRGFFRFKPPRHNPTGALRAQERQHHAN